MAANDAEYAADAQHEAGTHYEELEDADVEAANDPEQSTSAMYDALAQANPEATTAAENKGSAEIDSDATIDAEDEEMAEVGVEATTDAKNEEMAAASVEPRVYLKDLSIELMELYPAITKLIPGRPKAQKYETNMAAATQIMAMFSFIKGKPDYLYFPSRTKREDEETAMEALNDDITLTPEIIAVLKEVWELWDITINYASHIKANVFDKSFYGPPNNMPWIEFVAIAALIAKHYEIYEDTFYTDEDGEEGVYPVIVILQDISRLRRWLRSNLKADGFRRNNNDWQQCWYIIDRDREDKGFILPIPDISNYHASKRDGPFFVFEAEPELQIEYE